MASWNQPVKCVSFMAFIHQLEHKICLILPCFYKTFSKENVEWMVVKCVRVVRADGHKLELNVVIRWCSAYGRVKPSHARSDHRFHTASTIPLDIDIVNSANTFVLLSLVLALPLPKIRIQSPLRVHLAHNNSLTLVIFLFIKAEAFFFYHYFTYRLNLCVQWPDISLTTPTLNPASSQIHLRLLFQI